MTALSETRHAGSFIISEGRDSISRDSITVKSGQAAMVAGTILGKTLVLDQATSAAKSGGNTGAGTLTVDGTEPVLAYAIDGTYTVRCIATATNSGTFRVSDPKGRVLGDVVVGATFADQIKFAIADGSPDFAVGDGFDVAVIVGGEKCVQLNPSATDGSQVATGVLFDAVDASAGDAPGVALTRTCQLFAAEVTWPSGISAEAQAAATETLAQAQIILR